MAKSKTQPSISKPVFDPETALRFAAGEIREAAAGQAEKFEAAAATAGPGKSVTGGYVAVTVQIREELLQRARAEASRKGKTLDEYIGKLISKHLGKH